jgi:hypothetical protein
VPRRARAEVDGGRVVVVVPLAGCSDDQRAGARRALADGAAVTP